MDFNWHDLWLNIPFIMQGMKITLRITFIAIIFGILWGTVLAIMYLSRMRWIRVISRGYVTVFRTIPLVMVLLWFYLLVPQFLSYAFDLPAGRDIRLMSAIVAFSLFEAAYYSEIMRAGIQSVSKGQLNAALALGMTRWQSLRLIVLPQAFRIMTPLLLTQGIILFQDTTLVYVISLADFFYQSVEIVGKRDGTYVQMIVFSAVVYFVVCSVASGIVSYIKNRIV